MHFLSTRAIALGMLLLGAGHATPIVEIELETRQQTARENCASGIHMIVGPGKGAAGKNGLLQTLINSVKRNVSGSNARTIQYDGTAHPITEARPRFTRYVKTYAESCPNTPIFLLGYSTGGILSMDVLCGASEFIGPDTQPINKKYKEQLIAMVSYGEETWRANQSYDYNDNNVCLNDAPQFPRQRPEQCANFASVMRSYCTRDDGACCANAIGDPAVHKLYPMRYDSNALSFVLDKYNSYRLTHPIPGLPGIPSIPTFNGIVGGTPIDIAKVAANNGFVEI